MKESFVKIEGNVGQFCHIELGNSVSAVKCSNKGHFNGLIQTFVIGMLYILVIKNMGKTKRKENCHMMHTKRITLNRYTVLLGCRTMWFNIFICVLLSILIFVKNPGNFSCGTVHIQNSDIF